MKRLSIIGALASIALAALSFASEANAAIKAPPAPPSGVCTQVISGSGAWPVGKHTYYCHAATQADGMLMYNVLNSYVAGASLNSTEMQNLSAFINRGNFYLYDTPAHFNSDFPGWQAASATAASVTENDPTTGEPLFTAVFLENNNGTSNDFIQNATAHELGHWVDAIDGAALLNQETITLDGTITTNDKISLTVTNAPFTSVTVSATSSATSTPTTLATALAAAVNANATLKNNGYTATSNGPSIVITFAYATRPVSGPTYSYSVSGAKTETVYLDMGPKASGTTLFGHGLVGNPANSNGDEHVFNQLQNCTSGSTTGVFAQQQDFKARYICSTLETGTVGGAPIKANDVLTLTITDSALGAANPVQVKVTAVAGDTAITLATKISQGINNNANLTAAKITATATGTDPNVKITTASGNPTTFAFASTGAETMNLPPPVYGANSSLSTFVYNGANNWANLLIAWPSFFSLNAEDYAETFATYSGFTDTTYPDGVTNPTSLDHYILAPSSNGFACSKNIIFTSGNDRLPPSVSSFPAQCPTN